MWESKPKEYNKNYIYFHILFDFFCFVSQILYQKWDSIELFVSLQEKKLMNPSFHWTDGWAQNKFEYRNVQFIYSWEFQLQVFYI